MGTRSLTMVYSDGEYKVAQYGQFDGYPEDLGCYILNFLKNNNIKLLKERVNEIGSYSKDDIEKINEYIKEKRSKDPFYYWPTKFPHLSRECRAEVLEKIIKKEIDKVNLELNFAADSLFCEWAYVIDLDNNTLEIFDGINKTKLDENDRFYFLEEKSTDPYHPIKFLIKFDLNNLPEEKEFIEKIYKAEEEQ